MQNNTLFNAATAPAIQYLACPHPDNILLSRVLRLATAGSSVFAVVVVNHPESIELVELMRNVLNKWLIEKRTVVKIIFAMLASGSEFCESFRSFLNGFLALYNDCEVSVRSSIDREFFASPLPPTLSVCKHDAVATTTARRTTRASTRATARTPLGVAPGSGVSKHRHRPSSASAPAPGPTPSVTSTTLRTSKARRASTPKPAPASAPDPAPALAFTPPAVPPAPIPAGATSPPSGDDWVLVVYYLLAVGACLPGAFNNTHSFPGFREE